MKAKYAYLVLVSVISLGSANAVTLNLLGVTNSTVGFITDGLSDTLSTGSATFYSSSVDLSVGDVSGVLGSADMVAAFEGLLGDSTPGSPGLVRGPVAFSAGAFTLNQSTDMGDVGNNTYLFLANADNSFVGLYQGANVPGGGAVIFNPNSVTEDLIGTSAPEVVGSVNSGFQLAAVPEPSTLLLSALGVLGVLRRKR